MRKAIRLDIIVLIVLTAAVTIVVLNQTVTVDVFAIEAPTAEVVETPAPEEPAPPEEAPTAEAEATAEAEVTAEAES